ncbi:MAG: hypothetical protein QOI35_1900 [Cryptosporangiaceae bacterium]|jgi:hypothetical protein|nr:hypothetical protein [Cryptosporangiaceae bacterium]
MAIRENWRAALAAALCLGALSILTGCTGGGTPLCDQAGSFAGKAQLGQAAGTYAEAQRQGEGNCAADGLDAVAAKQAGAFAAAAQGQAAERAGDLTTARTRYQAALEIDAGNGQAAAGLIRVTRRPAELGPLWFRAQRLHDEGLDDAARTEIVAVLKAHPDESVPQSLATLTSPAPAAQAAPAPQAGGPQSPAAAARPALAGWMTWLLLAAALLLAGALYALGLLHARTRRDHAAGFAGIGDKLVVLSHDLARVDKRRAATESRLAAAHAELRADVDAQRAEAERLLTALQPDPDTETTEYLAPIRPVALTQGRTSIADLRLYRIGEYLLLRRVTSEVPDADVEWLAGVLSGGDPDPLRRVFGPELTEHAFDPDWTAEPELWIAEIPGNLTPLLALLGGELPWRTLALGELTAPGDPLVVPSAATVHGASGDLAAVTEAFRLVQLTAIVSGPAESPLLAQACLRSLPQSLLAQPAARAARAALALTLSVVAATEAELTLPAEVAGRDRERELLSASLARHEQWLAEAEAAEQRATAGIVNGARPAPRADAAPDPVRPPEPDHQNPPSPAPQITVVRIEEPDQGDPGHFVKSAHP